MAKERVLVIDDRRENIVFLANQILKPNGYQVTTARDGETGLQKALEETPDLIVTDLRMPKMGGIEILRELDKAGRSIPAIITTFHGSEELAIEAFKLGARDYLIKPYEIEAMLEAIDRALAPERRFKEEKSALQDNVAQVNKQLERRVKELRILSGIGKAVTSVLNTEKVLQRIVEAATFLTNAEEAFLMLIDEESGELYMRAVQGMGKKYTRFRQKVDDSMAGQVIRTGQPVRIGRDRGKKSHEVMTGYLVRDLLNVPIQVRERVIGVLGVDNLTAKEGFTENHEYLLSALADYASIAIDNSNLYELMEKRALEITQLFESHQSSGSEEQEQQLRVREKQIEEERAHLKMIAEQLHLLGTQLEEIQTRIKNA
ncbi:MAG: response regulator [Anaerolineae bacterium]|nr:response regulator [Anaerolineae bacterium]